VLLVLLVEREVLRASGGERARTATRVLDLAILPLLVAFLLIVALRLNQVLTGS